MKKILAMIVLAVAAACSTTEPGVTPAPTQSPTSPGSTGSPGSTTEVTVYYLVAGSRDMYLTAERHQVAGTPAIARAALDDLLEGERQDPDHDTPFSEGTEVNSVAISDGLATVDWNAKVLEPAGAGARAEQLAIQSVVYTLTEFSTVDRVRFTVEGKASGTASNGRSIEDFWGHVGLGSQPFEREPEIEILAPITLSTPHEGATSQGTLELTGTASTFEANVGIILRDAAGEVVVQTSTTAEAGAPERGAFRKTISFTPPAAAETWTLHVFESSAEDGSTFFEEDRGIRVG